MTLQAKLFIPAMIWLTIGVAAIHNGRRLVQVGYEIDRTKSQIYQVRDRNQHLAIQGSKLKSPKRVLTLAENLGLKLEVSGVADRPGTSAPSTAASRRDAPRARVQVAERKNSSGQRNR